MSRKKKTWVTIETERLLAIALPRSHLAVCGSCAAEVHMVPVDEAAVLAGVSSRAIYRWVEGGELHFEETSQGLLFICLASLFQRVPAGKRIRALLEDE